VYRELDVDGEDGKRNLIRKETKKGTSCEEDKRWGLRTCARQQEIANERLRKVENLSHGKGITEGADEWGLNGEKTAKQKRWELEDEC
jgi:hypothetical protein